MAFKMRGFSAFTKQEDEKTYYADPAHMDEIKLTDKYPSKKAKQKGEKRKLTQKLHSNPVIKSAHGKTDKAANVINKVASTAASLYSGAVILGMGHKVYKAKKLFNLKKYKDPLVKTVKNVIKKVAPVAADDVAIQTVNKNQINK
tara:strand:+ start:87 stop:521 length:435 start_codon:yes stop_codon:yes gene_type:complete